MERAERDAVFHREFLEDLRFWVKKDRNAALRILELVEARFGIHFRASVSRKR